MSSGLLQTSRFKYHRKASLEDRFWGQVEKTPEHWWWKGTKDKDGYGYICSGGSATKGAKYKRCHRVAWELTRGAIPEGIHVLHACDHPSCVNPEHLFLGTELDNARDRNSKGRHQFGDTHSQSKLTEEKVREIRLVYALGGINQTNLAKKYGVNQTIISDVIRRVTWKHVTDNLT